MLNKKLKKVIASVTMFATVLCFSSVSMLALPLSAQAATAIVDGDIVKTNVTNSDGTPSISSLDVYIVKTVGSKKFKRLVLNPNIFASYSHLKWENLKTVSQAEIDVYTTSSLVRVDGNDKVYAITPVTGGDTGAKSWINLTAAQFLSLPQSDPDSIYTINATDGAAYSAKVDITTVAQLTAFYADGTLPDTTSENMTAVKYVNNDYGFEFALPDNWKGYSIVEEKWESYAYSDTVGWLPVAEGPQLSIRHSQWTKESPRQDIPIMVFTLIQWNDMQSDKFHIGAAPINPSELGRNNKYVFALPARYNWAFPAGYEEVEKILEGSPLHPFDI